MTWLLAYVLTVAIEVPLAAALAPRGRRRRIVLDAFLLNTFTHPILTVAVRAEWIGFGPGEILVWIVEAIGYRAVTGLATGRALLVSTIANGITVFLALALAR
ncbi:MAG: hypothetical protein ACF8XB_24665 [Planctomycetota bacterium JB042]